MRRREFVRSFRYATVPWPRHARAWKLGTLRRLFVGACLVLLASHPAPALEQVSIQLKWKHQFQFAGYYAALELGFYRDAGLDVSIREGGPDIDVTDTVATGKADFGVCSANVLRDWTAGRRLVVLAVIFTPRPSFWCRDGPTSATFRNYAAVRSWTRREVVSSPQC